MQIPLGRKVWGGVLLVAGAVEAYGIIMPNEEDTLSEFTRWAFHVDTPAGRAAFVVVWGTFSSWFVYHILSGRSKK